MILSYKINEETNKVYIKKDINSYILKELDRLYSDKKIMFVYDQNVSSQFVKNILDNLKLSGCEIVTLRLTGSKINKSSNTLFKILDYLIDNKFTKKSVLISLGGGVIGDISGLASSLYLRGLIYMHIPTTITAIVDSCIGGKCGVNYREIINSLGTYHHPKSVFIDLRVLNDMPEREYLAGIPEILKYGLIKNKNIINYLISYRDLILKRNHKILEKLIYFSLQTKLFFFINDIFEKNKRLNLNFGHTFAHAYEMSTQKIFGKEIIRHGEAVGVGMLSEILYSNNGKINEIYIRCKKILESYNLPSNLELYNSKSNLMDLTYKNIFLDKKKISKFPRYIKLKKIGEPKISEMKNMNLINDVLFEMLGY